MNPKDIKDAVEGAVDALDSKPEKKTFSQSMLIAIISALIGTMTTWGLSIDARVYKLAEETAEAQELVRMEDRIMERLREVSSNITVLTRKLGEHLEKHK